MRHALAVAEVPQPEFVVIQDPEQLPTNGYPCVVKPVGRSGSQGVIRADDAEAAHAATVRVLAIAGAPLLVEEYLPGVEVAVEGLLRAGELHVLAVFDKPDPLVGPYFEETLYVTPSRLDAATLARVGDITARACAAIGLVEGPVHAELRIDGDRVRVIEVAARSIGGLCAARCALVPGIALEELILRHALSMPIEGMTHERAASGVMMLPITRAGVLQAVDGQDTARAVPGVTGLEITIPRGRRVVPLPEGDRYLGFVFARGDTPNAVETSLRTAHAALTCRDHPVAWSRADPPRRDLRARATAGKHRCRGRGPARTRRRRARDRRVGRPVGPRARALGRRSGVLRADAHCHPPRPGARVRGRPTGAGVRPVCRAVSDSSRTPSTGRRHCRRRDLLPPLDRYARLAIGDEERLVGSVVSVSRLRTPLPALPGTGRVRRSRPSVSTRTRCSPTSRNWSKQVRSTSRSATPTS